MNIEDPRIQLYIDNELSEQEKLDLESQLLSYPEIQEYIAFKRFIIEGIQSEGDEELKEYIRTRVQDEGSENQTNLWLYAVATVTLVLVSYFFIIQYIKTGSIKEASKVLVLNEPTSPKEKQSRYKLEEVPNTAQLDTNIFAVDSSNNLALNDFPSTGSANPQQEEKAMSADEPSTVYSWDFGDSRKDLSLDREETIVHQSNLVPIKLAVNTPSENDDQLEKPVPAQLGKISRSAIESKSKKEISRDKVSVLQDSISISANSLSEVKKANLQIRKFTLYFIQNTSGKPTIDVNYKDGSAILKLINIDSENPLVYFINDKYYLELGPKLIYFIPQNNTKLITPKPITDKALIKAIQN